MEFNVPPVEIVHLQSSSIIINKIWSWIVQSVTTCKCTTRKYSETTTLPSPDPAGRILSFFFLKKKIKKETSSWLEHFLGEKREIGWNKKKCLSFDSHLDVNVINKVTLDKGKVEKFRFCPKSGSQTAKWQLFSRRQIRSKWPGASWNFIKCSGPTS